MATSRGSIPVTVGTFEAWGVGGGGGWRTENREHISTYTYAHVQAHIHIHTQMYMMLTVGCALCLLSFWAKRRRLRSPLEPKVSLGSELRQGETHERYLSHRPTIAVSSAAAFVRSWRSPSGAKTCGLRSQGYKGYTSQQLLHKGLTRQQADQSAGAHRGVYT